EELKKPTQTYIILIDEALRNHPTGIMDLQEIYDKICKRYPYYKYRANTTGWQSSVRHNLISCERFVEAGKQGKGRLWKID
ncbi:winged helix DNA-binding domain-containing protein, partial [Polychaeton citri CBS 116435]